MAPGDAAAGDAAAGLELAGDDAGDDALAAIRPAPDRCPPS